jgi:hypothetical protein
MTAGAYHRLANCPAEECFLGWHPNYSAIFGGSQR